MREAGSPRGRVRTDRGDCLEVEAIKVSPVHAKGPGLELLHGSHLSAPGLVSLLQQVQQLMSSGHSLSHTAVRRHSHQN